MKRMSVRGLLLSVAMLSALAIAAAPANATITPVNANISGSSTNTQLLTSAGAIRCPTAEVTGNVNAAGTAIVGRITFSGNAASRTTCTANGGITSASVSCPGDLTLSVDSSVAGSGASGSATLANDGVRRVFCSIDIPAQRCTIDVFAQGPVSGITFTQGTQILQVNIRIRTVGRSPCPTGDTTFTGTFRIDSVNRVRGGRITIS